MYSFPIEDCDLSLNVDGTETQIPGLHDIPVATDPHGHHLTRGNGTTNDDEGIIYVQGNGQPIEQTIQFKSTRAMGDYLRKLYKEKKRINFTLVNRITGAMRQWPNAIFAAEPRQGAISEGAETTTISLQIECFRIVDTIPGDNQ